MTGRLVVTIAADAVAHLAQAVLGQLALAEIEAGSPEAVSWPAVRDRALSQLQAQAALGDSRAASTWAAIVQASYDVEFSAIVAGPEVDDEEGPT